MIYLISISLMVIGLFLSPFNHVPDNSLALIGGVIEGVGACLLMLAIFKRLRYDN